MGAIILPLFSDIIRKQIFVAVNQDAVIWSPPPPFPNNLNGAWPEAGPNAGGRRFSGSTRCQIAAGAGSLKCPGILPQAKAGPTCPSSAQTPEETPERPAALRREARPLPDLASGAERGALLLAVALWRHQGAPARAKVSEQPLGAVAVQVCRRLLTFAPNPVSPNPTARGAWQDRPPRPGGGLGGGAGCGHWKERQAYQDPHNLKICCRVNGEVVQSSNTNQMVFKTEELIAWVSQFVTLYPGDVILTGTPPGVGVFRKPPVFLKKGDEVQCEIEELGIIINKVV
ncbi:uncharacterized protein [Canis lupus baileyi]|uniref:uncharacterized protein LOC112664436 isoform X2 n=1 Tax=Canis lupus dingo TaxID=286419 RepID=UPI0020C4EF19|nr:uncharacterized protein LOC112664436 isoform X2 [Canis lupus dingo]